jgi:predicted amidohydrolase
VRIALAQVAAGADKEANLRRALELAAEAAAAGAALVLFPECSMVHLPPDRNPAPLAEPLDGPFVSALGDAARRHRIAVVAGVYEPAPGGDRVFNTVVALDRTGSRLGSYRKVHLYDAFGHRESDRVVPGDGDTLRFAVEGVAFGVETCYDVRFPELSRHLAARGAEVVLLPAAWLHGPLKESHWEILVRARAIESTVYVAAAGLAGRPFTGCSMLVDPMGVAVARAGEAEALVVGEVDLERLRAARRVNPSLGNTRPDLYARWLEEAAAPVRS